jgi:NADPH:quinone reductase-like Zn-dependent oxidoreductase
MRAVWYDRQGAADEVLVCGELPTPEAGHGEVRVRQMFQDMLLLIARLRVPPAPA